MNIEEGKALLIENGFAFEEVVFKTKADYWRHLCLFPCEKKAVPKQVIALVLHSNNEKKNVELLFEESDEDFLFKNLFFGEYDYELFDMSPTYLPTEIIDIITAIVEGKTRFIAVYDLKKKKWYADAAYNCCDDGENGCYEKAIKRIETKKRFWEKLSGSRKQYEIYDWNTYRCVVK